MFVPPDLSLIARSRSPDWLYTYFKSFYRDLESPSGWNNTLFENVSMPHALYELQGDQMPKYEDDGQGGKKMVGFELVREGTQTPEEFDQSMTDLVRFLVYLAEPAQLQRKSIGILVLLFLLVLLIPCFLMKKEFWRDVH